MRFKVSIPVIFFSLLMITLTWSRGIETFDDSKRYISAMQLLQGKPVIYEEKTYTHAVIPMLVNPATIYISTGFGKLLGSEWRGLAFFNALLYVGIVLVFYNLARLLFSHSRDVHSATVLFATTYSLFRFGIGSYMVDIGGWFFYILGLYFATRFYYSQQEKYAIITGIVSMVGLFFKEYGGVGILALLVFIIMSPLSNVKKIKLAVASCSFFMVNIAFHVWSYFEKGYLYFRRYGTVVDAFAAEQTILRTIKVLGSFFSIGWPFALWGTIKASDHMQSGKKVLWAFVPSSLIFFAYPAYDQRISFIAIPLLVFLATLGLARIRSTMIVVMILTLYAAANIFMPVILVWFNLDSLLRFIF